MAHDHDKASVQEPDFDWIQLNRDMDASIVSESGQDKFIRKFKENPFVPIGCMVTLGALTYGLWSFRKGRTQMSQYMMRLRIVAQGFTVVAMMGGIALAASKSKSKVE